MSIYDEKVGTWHSHLNLKWKFNHVQNEKYRWQHIDDIEGCSNEVDNSSENQMKEFPLIFKQDKKHGQDMIKITKLWSSGRNMKFNGVLKAG